MKRALAVLALALLTGCDYNVPLVATPATEIDRQILGVWERPTSSNATERLLVLPLNKNEYLVSYPSATPSSMFAKGSLVQCAGKTLVQLEWFGTAEGSLPDDPRVYQFASYSVTGDELTVRLLNTSAVSKETASSAELAKAIEEKKDAADLFCEPMVFKKESKQP